MTPVLTPILEALNDHQAALHAIQEILLANTVLFSEIPAPTFREKQRIRFLLDRFTEEGLENVSRDEVDNGIGILPGTEGKNNILIVAHVDTPFDAATDHTVSVSAETLKGPSIGDNTLGLAAIASLPTMLKQLDVKLNNNLILMGSSQSLGRGDLQGLRFFLDNNTRPIQAGVCVEGVHLGRLSYSALGMFRGNITCEIPDDYDWTRFGAQGAIDILAHVISSIQQIPLPRDPRTSILFGSISGGTGYNAPPSTARLCFEVRSEDAQTVNSIHQKITDITTRITEETEVNIHFDTLAQRAPGGIPYAHPLVKTTRQIMEALEIKARIAPSSGELAALISKEIPSVTVGLTTGIHINEHDETIQIKPIFKGITQLIALLQAIDQEGGNYA